MSIIKRFPTQIRNCSECPFLRVEYVDTEFYQPFCNRTQELIGEYDDYFNDLASLKEIPIPEDCPLETIKED